MEIQIGSAVLSKAGRDKGRYMAVVGKEGDALLVADGTLRRIERPKKKNILHLGMTNTIISKDQLTDNRKLKTALKGRFGSMLHDEEV